MRFGVLGALEVIGDSGAALTPEAGKQRVLLAVLLCYRNTPVSVDRIVDLLWADPPESARANLQVSVYRLRQRLGTDRIEHSPAGYRLRTADDEVDDERFQTLAADGLRRLVAGDADGARYVLTEALDLWRGPAYAGLDAVEPARGEARRLDELRLATLENRIRADLEAGLHTNLIAEVTQLVAEHPLREGMRESLMLALYRAGRAAEALEVYREGRQVAVDELGLEPGPGLRELERAILAGDQSPDQGQQSVARRLYSVPAELPAADASFTGRDLELAQLDRVLKDPDLNRSTPVVAISGPGGAGKSALALQAAHRVADRFPDGQLYLDLHGATPGADPVPPRQALGRLLRSLGVTDTAVPEDTDEAAALFRSITADRKMLILLDNAADATQIRPLLPGTSGGCAVLVTSRVILGMLDVAHHIPLTSLIDADAIALLERLAGADRVEAEPASAAEMVALCGHLPLALRIAGARLIGRPDWTLSSMCERLRDGAARLDELEYAELAVRASCAVSHRGLSGAAARTLAALGLLDLSEVTAPVAAALTATTVPAARSALDRLVEAQLLTVVRGERYVRHDLIRLYTRELAAETFSPAEHDAAVTRVLHHYLATARAAMNVLAPGRAHRLRAGIVSGDLVSEPLDVADGDAAGAWTRAETGNLVTLVRHAATLPDGGPAIVVGFGAVLTQLLHSQSRWAEQAVVARITVDVARRSGRPEWTAQALNDVGMVSTVLGRYERAEPAFLEALEIYRSLGDDLGVALIDDSVGNLYYVDSRYQEAERHHQRAVEAFRKAGQSQMEARSLGNLSKDLSKVGTAGSATAAAHAALRLYTAAGDVSGEALTLLNLGDLHMGVDDTEAAIKSYERAAAVFSRIGYGRREGIARWQIGTIRHQQGLLDEARAQWRRALELLRDVGLMTDDEMRQILVDQVPERPELLRET